MDLFRKSAGYRFLDAFVLANVVELGTGHFCNRFLDLRNDPGGRTFAQMTHAARSGRRNFAEGSERLMTSYSSAIELLDVARASLCELRDDYNKWLMMQRHAPWPMESEEAKRVYGVRLDPPDCGAPTRLRRTRDGNRPFWGCTGYPACRGIVKYEEKESDSNRHQAIAGDRNRSQSTAHTP